MPSADSVRDLLPYSRPFWTEQEVDAVAEVVRSGMWTNGPKCAEFESALRSVVGARELVAVSSGTTAIHAILHALRDGTGRNLFVTAALNFAAGPAIAKQLGYDLAFTDVDRTTLGMSLPAVSSVLASVSDGYDRIVVMPVHFAGVAVDIDALVDIAAEFDAVVLEDACHALPARYPATDTTVGSHPRSIGALFSFHPTKSVAAGEGGAIAVRDEELARRLRGYRNHNMNRDVGRSPAGLENGVQKPWYYEIDTPGHNFRLSEFHAAIGLVQLSRLDESLDHRRRLAARYRRELAGSPLLRYLPADDYGTSGLHLFPVSLDLDGLGTTRTRVFEHYRRHGVALQVHYTPLTEQSAFADALGGRELPGLAHVSPGLVSLPLFAGMSDADQDRVLAATSDLLNGGGGR